MAQSVLAGRRMKRVGVGALITWEMYWLCPCGTAPRGRRALPAESCVSDVAAKLLLNAVHQYSYPKTSFVCF